MIATNYNTKGSDIAPLVYPMQRGGLPASIGTNGNLSGTNGNLNGYANFQPKIGIVGALLGLGLVVWAWKKYGN